MVKAPISLAIPDTMPPAPVPVPPPRPHVMKTASALAKACLISSSASRVASSPIWGIAPAPNPRVVLRPSKIFWGTLVERRCCASVLAAIRSAPSIPSSTSLAIVLQPPPPQPMILIFVFNLANISCSCSSTCISDIPIGSFVVDSVFKFVFALEFVVVTTSFLDNASSIIDFIISPQNLRSSSHPIGLYRV